MAAEDALRWNGSRRCRDAVGERENAVPQRSSRPVWPSAASTRAATVRDCARLFSVASLALDRPGARVPRADAHRLSANSARGSTASAYGTCPMRPSRARAATSSGHRRVARSPCPEQQPCERRARAGQTRSSSDHTCAASSSATAAASENRRPAAPHMAGHDWPITRPAADGAPLRRVATIMCKHGGVDDIALALRRIVRRDRSASAAAHAAPSSGTPRQQGTRWRRCSERGTVKRSDRERESASSSTRASPRRRLRKTVSLGRRARSSPDAASRRQVAAPNCQAAGLRPRTANRCHGESAAIAFQRRPPPSSRPRGGGEVPLRRGAVVDAGSSGRRARGRPRAGRRRRGGCAPGAYERDGRATAHDRGPDDSLASASSIGQRGRSAGPRAPCGEGDDRTRSSAAATVSGHRAPIWKASIWRSKGRRRRQGRGTVGARRCAGPGIVATSASGERSPPWAAARLSGDGRAATTARLGGRCGIERPNDDRGSDASVRRLMIRPRVVRKPDAHVRRARPTEEGIEPGLGVVRASPARTVPRRRPERLSARRRWRRRRSAGRQAAAWRRARGAVRGRAS